MALLIKNGNQKFGPHHMALDANNHCRTEAQFRAVLKLCTEAQYDLDFVCGDALTPEYPGQKFHCSFQFSFYDRKGNYCGAWITPTGRVTHGGGPRHGLVERL